MGRFNLTSAIDLRIGSPRGLGSAAVFSPLPLGEGAGVRAAREEMQNAKCKMQNANCRLQVGSGQWAVGGDPCEAASGLVGSFRISPSPSLPLSPSFARGASAAAKRSPPFPFPLPPSGFTLIEILVVITIILMLLGAAAATMQSAGQSRRVREAARAVNVYLASARSRAMETGRPCGVTFRNFSGTGGTTVPCAMNADQCETPPCYAGVSTTSVGTVTYSGGPTVSFNLSDGSIADGLVRVHDHVQFNSQGPYYEITADNTTNSNGYVTTGMLTLSFEKGLVVPWNSNGTVVPYRMFCAPTKGAAMPLQLPAGSVVDIQFSGTNTSHQFGSIKDDVTIVFSPDGSVRVGTGDLTDATETIYLLIGQRARVGQSTGSPTSDNESDWANWQDLNNYWVVINPHTGAVSTAPVGQEAGGMPGGFGDARGLAAKAVATGGR
jgi:prepilin-type N-terminal cleavage/methylation domain-containing protein